MPVRVCLYVDKCIRVFVYACSELRAPTAYGKLVEKNSRNPALEFTTVFDTGAYTYRCVHFTTFRGAYCALREVSTDVSKEWLGLI